MPPQDRTAWSFNSRTVHHPAVEAESPPVAAPLYQSSTFRTADAETIARYAGEVQPQAFYTRWGNPTTEALEKLMADLEGGQRCLAFASGMAAVSTTLLGLLEPGDHVVAGASLYTGTTKLLTDDLPKLGISVDFVDPTDSVAFAERENDKTRMFYTETPTNPMMHVTDLAALCGPAKEHRIVTVVDNTFATPYNQRPIEAGVDVVIHSATKYLSGHSDVVAGCLVSDQAIAEKLWYKRTHLGGCLDPFAAWLVLRGMKTLALRVERHNENALAVARMLQSHEAVSRVMYPGLPEHPQHALAAGQMDGFGGMLSFELASGREAGARLIESTQLALLAVSLGSVETLIQHPASTSHAMLSEAELQRAGIPAGLVRLSVGIEDADDLIADLEQGLAGLE